MDTISQALGNGAYLNRCLFLFTVVLLLFATQVSGQCEQWDVSGAWSLKQSDHITVHMNLWQNGKDVVGTSEYSTEVNGVTKTFFGTVEGEARKNNFVVEVRWSNIGKQIGMYNAKFDSKGRLNGSIYIQSGTGARGRDTITWSSVGEMKCAALVSKSPIETPSPVVPQCTQWDVSGAWSLKQSDYITVHMNLRQNGKDVVGTSEYSTEVNGVTKTQGRLNGSIYIQSGGATRGRDTITWASTGAMKCAARASN